MNVYLFIGFLSVCAVIVGLTWHWVTLQRTQILEALREATLAVQSVADAVEGNER